MKSRRPRNSTIGALIIFLVSFGFWLTQPQPDKPIRSVLFPDVNFVFGTTTTTSLPPPDTVPETTVVEATTIPPETVPPVDTTLPPVDLSTTTTVAG